MTRRAGDRHLAVRALVAEHHLTVVGSVDSRLQYAVVERAMPARIALGVGDADRLGEGIGTGLELGVLTIEQTRGNDDRGRAFVPS